jgi:hypothetical protein
VIDHPAKTEPECLTYVFWFGLLSTILEAVCTYAASAGYPTAEGYPVEPRDGKRAGSDTAMTGIASAFLKAGFAEVARPAPRSTDHAAQTPRRRMTRQRSVHQRRARPCRWRLTFSRFPQVLMLHQRRRPPREESKNNQPHRPHALIRSGGTVNTA